MGNSDLSSPSSAVKAESNAKIDIMTSRTSTTYTNKELCNVIRKRQHLSDDNVSRLIITAGFDLRIDFRSKLKFLLPRYQPLPIYNKLHSLCFRWSSYIIIFPTAISI